MRKKHFAGKRGFCVGGCEHYHNSGCPVPPARHYSLPGQRSHLLQVKKADLTIFKTPLRYNGDFYQLIGRQGRHSQLK